MSKWEAVLSDYQAPPGGGCFIAIALSLAACWLPLCALLWRLL